MSGIVAPTPQKGADLSLESGTQTPRKHRGDRGNAYKREKLIAGRTAKEMGVKKGTHSVQYFFAICEHKNKRGKSDCEYGPKGKKRFTGSTPEIVMGNKALHEFWHETEDRKRAERGDLA